MKGVVCRICIGEIRKECLTSDKTGREGVLLFDLTCNLINEKHQTLYGILYKYKLVYDVENVHKKRKSKNHALIKLIGEDLSNTLTKGEGC